MVVCWFVFVGLVFCFHFVVGLGFFKLSKSSFLKLYS